MKKNISRVGVLVMMSFTLTACASAPQSREEDGVNYAITDSESNIDEAIKNGLENKEQFIQKNDNGYTCVCELGKGDDIFRINADVTNYEVKTIFNIDVTPNPLGLNIEQINKLLFNDEMIEDTNIESSDTDVQGEHSASVGMQSTQQLNYTNKAGTKTFNSSTDAGFLYFNNTLSQQYNRIDLNGGKISDFDISEQYTEEMAINDLEKTILDISGMDIMVSNSKSITDENGNGYYEFEFVSCIDGIPLAVNDREINMDNTIDSYGVATIGKDGIAKIEATNLLWEKVKEDDEKTCLKLGEVLSLLEKYISDGQLSCNKELIFSNCELVYLARTDDWTHAELIPVWRFYIPIDQLVESTMGELAMNDDIPTDICINAIDGTIEQMK